MKIEQQTIDELLIYLENNKHKYVNSTLIILNVPEIKNQIKLREIINQLRTNGKTIVSSKSGYKLSDNIEEIFTCVFNLKHRANKICNAAIGMITSTVEIN